MIKYNISTDQKKFWTKFFQLHNVMQKKERRLTNAEIEFSTLLIMCDKDPFVKEGRRSIMNVLGYTSSAFSVNLSRLAVKGVLIKNERKYIFHTQISRLKEFILKYKPAHIDVTFRLSFNEE